VELGHWHGAAIGDATNQPGLADAHDLALKTADSQALKRAAVNMGDQFGLSLYNNGSFDPVVNRSLAYMKPQEQPKPVADPPVQPEPGTKEAEDVSSQAAAAADSAQHVDRLKGQATRCWSNAVALSQVLKDAEKNEVADVEFDTQEGRQTLRALLTNRISVLNQNTTNGDERNVA